MINEGVIEPQLVALRYGGKRRGAEHNHVARTSLLILLFTDYGSEACRISCRETFLRFREVRIKWRG